MPIMFRILVTIKGALNSRELYEKLKQYGISVTDLGQETLVYDDEPITAVTAATVLLECLQYGDCSAMLSRVRPP